LIKIIGFVIASIPLTVKYPCFFSGCGDLPEFMAMMGSEERNGSPEHPEWLFNKIGEIIINDGHLDWGKPPRRIF